MTILTFTSSTHRASLLAGRSMCVYHMSSTAENLEKNNSSHTHERIRCVRHSYEEVDLDWPDKDGDKLAQDNGHNIPNSHSYEDVDFLENGTMEVVPAAPPDLARGDVKGDAKGQGPVRINLSHTIRRLRMCGWYWGDISSEQAKEILRRTQNGSFILRDSSDACHLFTLSLKANNIIVSVRVAFSRGLFKLDSWNQEDSPSFNSVVDMIEYYLEDESHEFYVELPNIGEFRVCLRHPIWKEVPELQHMCRTTVVKYCRTSEKLGLLPLPPHLIRYVLEFSPEDSTGSDASAYSDGSANSDDADAASHEGRFNDEDDDSGSSSSSVLRNIPAEPTA